jgi:membrane protein implicated in regulation of membrane protease activity
MRALLTSLRDLIFGETWTIPLGVGAALAVSLLLRDALPESIWSAGGGFVLAAVVIATVQTRQADRDKRAADERVRIADAQREQVEAENETLEELLKANRALTERVAGMVAEVHAATCGGPGSRREA